MNNPISQVRSVVLADAYALWLWANDSETRNASFHREFIPWIDHIRWLDHRLSSSADRLLIVETEGSQPVGLLRYDSNDEWTTARLSYVVAPESRGLGFGRQMVAAARELIVPEHPNVCVFADVMRTNARSLRVFRTLGWTQHTLGVDSVRFLESAQ